MEQSNPTVLTNVTRFVPWSTRSGSRSPSRSPHRKAQFTAHELDPLLGNLSPDSTLKALSETNAVNTTGQKEQDLLTRSIAQTSPSERALGIRAAIAGKKVREWCTELGNWEWPSKKGAGLGKGFENPLGTLDEEHVGCLPLRILDHYEQRIEEIKDALDALEVEELKKYVLDAHIQIPSRSRPGSSNGEDVPPPLTFNQLSDFTAVITATIVQALPYLARLSGALNNWDVRIMVLRLVPPLLADLRATEAAVRGARGAIDGSVDMSKFTREDMISIKSKLESKVSSLGSQFDRALDALEGREDSLPERWIDQMDYVESEFANWVVAAEKRVFWNEWSAKNGSKKQPPSELTSSASLVESQNVRKTENLQGDDMSSTLPASVVLAAVAPPVIPNIVNHVGEDEGQSAHLSIMPELESNNLAPPSPDVNHVSVATKSDQVQESIRGDYKEVANVLPSSEATSVLLNSTSLPFDESNKSLVAQPFQGGARISGHHQEIESEPLMSPGNGILTNPDSSEVDEDTVASNAESNPSVGKFSGQSADPVLEQRSLAIPSDHDKPGLIDVDERDHSSVAIPIRHVLVNRPSSAGNHTDIESGRVSEFAKPATEEPRPPESLPYPSPRSFKFPMSPNLSRPKAVSQRPEPLHIPRSHKRDVSEVSVADSMVSDAFSDLSNAEILDASTAEIGSPTVVHSPARRFSSADMLSLAQRQSPQDLRPRSMHILASNAHLLGSSMPKHERAESIPDPPLPPEALPVQARPLEDDRRHEQARDELADTDFRQLRASVSSVELVPKNRVRSIVISRNSSHSSNMSPTERTGTPTDAMRALTGERSPSHRDSNELEGRPSRLSQEYSSATSTTSAEGHNDDLPSPIQTMPRMLSINESSSNTVLPTIPRRSSKRISRGLDSTLSPTTPTKAGSGSPAKSSSSSTSAKGQHSSPSSTKDLATKPVVSPAKSTNETIEEKIQDLLTTIPARIHLASQATVLRNDTKGAGPKAKSPKTKSTDNLSVSSYENSNPSTEPSTRSTTPTPSLTLTPALVGKGPRSSTSLGDNSEVKVYHLSRSGPNNRDAPPIKLFVRLVGEGGERVMVRVGGGWADLGEYLREYALHHGHGRSDRRFEVNDLPTSRRESDATGLGSSPVFSSRKRSVGDVRSASALDFYGSTPTSTESRRARRTSAAAATLLTGAESPSSGLPLSSPSEYDPAGSIDSDPPPPVPKIPDQIPNHPLHASPIPPYTPAPRSKTPTFNFGFSSPMPTQSPATPKTYTPLGAAGPKLPKLPKQPKSRVSSFASPNSNGRATPGQAQGANPDSDPNSNDSTTWVQDVLTKARRGQFSLPSSSSPASSPVSGNTPITSRKVSLAAPADIVASPNQGQQNTSHPSSASKDSESGVKARPKSRNRLSSFGLGGRDMSGGDGGDSNATGGRTGGSSGGGGIKRVFLRKKSSTSK